MNKSDPRPLLHRSFAQAHQVVATVAADQLALATPCSDSDVDALLRHMAGVGNRMVCPWAEANPRLGPRPCPPGLGTGVLVGAFARAKDQALSAWAGFLGRSAG